MALQLQMTWQPNLLHHKRKTGPPLGLKNLGNSCYLNSVLQCLTYTPPLANFCLNFQHSSFCDSASEPADRKRDCPFCILEKRIVRSLSMDLTLDAPSKILSCLRIFAEHFRCGRQEDAHEFLRYVIDACHNTCLRLKKLQQQRHKGGACNGNGHGNGESVNGSTVVKEIFGGALQSQVKCLSCGAESNKVDEIMDISLDVLHSSSLKEAMQKFFQPEVLDGNNKYKCEKCKKLVAAGKQMSILQAPNVLVIQLKRFEGIFGGKIDKEISFEEVLVLSSYMCKVSQDTHPEYNLFGTIVHSGYSPESGHYYAYIKDAMGRWYCCNDSYVSHSTLQEVLSEKVYILFFSRSNQRPVPAITNFPSSGVKSCDSNGINKSKVPKATLPLKAGHTQPQVEHSSGKGISTRSKVYREPSQNMKLSNSENHCPKRASTTNGTIDVHKKQSMGKNGDAKNSICTERSEKIKGNGVDRSKYDSVYGKNSQTPALANQIGKIQNIHVDSAKADLCEGNGTGGRVPAGRGSDCQKLHNGGVNGYSHIPAPKRKSQDKDPTCILLSKDIHSQEMLEELKEVLKKEASLVLRSCGWSDKVYSFMHSRKRFCAREAGMTKSICDASKKLLIADAKASFLSQIPESLKESLIERLRSFSKEKQQQSSGP
ncbi:ubiquitin carboxyl-terminal hydrolase 25 [Malania oleifera]|uniref:ubiquitin carboxyl-terminal hydrolase 25 n=1 Tax=Malania oleifera TaxID=397392 RepID=UPI0025AE233B|nr:ubiquitin carboxyl-terminal hydrolase 25 [Malania oleifera]XP_057949289.1 ubiquitin carboxyl-terminal hydrolase 25 [Malania oleifera]